MFERPVYLKQLIKFKDHEQIKVVTGIRRCGKSCLLDLFIEYLKSQNISEENIVKINFESLKYSNLDYIKLNELIENRAQSITGRLYVFLDEIQKIDKWELTVNSLRLNPKIDIYITGSNAYLLSSNLSTYLSGRYVEIKMQPLTFKEFLNFNKFAPEISIEAKFNLYLKYGGMPGLKDFNFDEKMIEQTQDGIFSAVMLKDIIMQSDIKNIPLLKHIADFLADNIGNPVSLNKIKNTLLSENTITKGMHPAVVDNYINLLENAFLFYGVKRCDIKGKEYLKTQGKYYIADTGLRNFLLGYRNIDRGHILENIVFLELLHRGYKISIGKINNKEIDFIAASSSEKKYIQVTETLLSEDTRKRELEPLLSIKDSYEKIILTMDNIFSGMDEKGIKIINIIDWLLN